jgi:hypothetical protein
MAVDLNRLNRQGIELADPIRPWHGAVAGSIRIDLAQQQLREAQLRLHKFGANKHQLTGYINHVNGQWRIPQLIWNFAQNHARFTTNPHGQVNIHAEYLDGAGISSLLQLPLTVEGHFSAQKLDMPWGMFTQASADYKLDAHQLHYTRFKSRFYQGSIQARKLDMVATDKQLHITARVQAGGISLQRWLWLHKQFDGYLEGNLYATLNLNADFTPQGKLRRWQGDGDIMVYNASWLLNQKRVQASRLALSINKREKFFATFDMFKHGQRGNGRITIDTDSTISGQFHWQAQRFQLYKNWPNLHYQQTSKNQTQ